METHGIIFSDLDDEYIPDQILSSYYCIAPAFLLAALVAVCYPVQNQRQNRKQLAPARRQKHGAAVYFIQVYLLSLLLLSNLFNF